VITEPLFSAGGVIPAPTVWLRALQAKCRERGMLLIFDEAQTGLAKLGTMFAFEQHGIVPDIVTISKHFGGGVSMSAAITTAAIEQTIAERGYVGGHSHSNDPLGCLAGIASIDIIVEENLPKKAVELGEYFQGILRRLTQKHEVIGDVRGQGLIQGIELVEERERRVPANAIGVAVHRRLLEKGLICSSRRGGSVLRFVPPFTTTRTQLDRAGELIDSAITEVLDQGAQVRGQLSELSTG
jgi:2,2-dialkylglycine decarboxylase (pyruvate)